MKYVKLYKECNTNWLMINNASSGMIIKMNFNLMMKSVCVLWQKLIEKQHKNSRFLWFK